MNTLPVLKFSDDADTDSVCTVMERLSGFCFGFTMTDGTAYEGEIVDARNDKVTLRSLYIAEQRFTLPVGDIASFTYL